MKRIGILYICTGPYALFWEDFYNSFEEKFITDHEKHYYVFTDSEELCAIDNKRVHKYPLQAQPWPLVTLLRFSTFLSIEKELELNDYLLFSNANIVCVEKIAAEEILPRELNDEDLFVTTHPGYFGKKIYEYPYERHSYSLAYIPWNLGSTYVIGAFFGGTSKAFLSLCKVLKANIEDDLKKNVIAKWHDESHLNRYIIGRKSVRIISPEYCYPVGMEVTYTPRITGVSKQAKFDVHSFKGVYSKPKLNFIQKLMVRIKSYGKALIIRWFYLRDKLLNKAIDIL